MLRRVFQTLTVLALLGLAWFCAQHLRVITSITHFLPKGVDQEVAEVSSFVNSELNRTIIVRVQSPEPGRTLEASKLLVARLAKHTEVARVVYGPPRKLQESMYALYFPRRHFFLSDEPEQNLSTRFSEAGVQETVKRLKYELQKPSAPLVRALAAEDPFLMFFDFLQRLKSSDTAFEVRDGHFVSNHGTTSWIFIETKHSAFDSSAQAPFFAWLDQEIHETRQYFGTNLTIRSASIHRIALASEAAIRADIQRVSWISTLLVFVLFLTAFRSLRVLWLAFLPLLAGVLVAAATTLAVYGQVHGLTLAFGASLIGVGVDYPIHFFFHYAYAAPGSTPWSLLRQMAPALMLGALTTILGLLGLAWTTLPGVREMALFAVVGVVTALVVTRWVLPLWVNEPIVVRAFQDQLGGFLTRIMFALRNRRHYAWVILAAAMGVCMLGFRSMFWADSLEQLYAVDQTLLQEERAVRSEAAVMEQGRLIVATGATEEEALQRNDAVAHILTQAQRAGEIKSFSSLHRFLWSESLQNRNVVVFRKQTQLPNTLQRALEREGFQTDAFAPVEAVFDAKRVSPLTWQDLKNSPLHNLVRPFRMQVGSKIAFVTYLSGVKDSRALQDRFALSSVFYLDQSEFFKRTYQRVRVQTVELLFFGIAAIVLLIFAKYRNVRTTFAIMTPPLLAAATVLAVVCLLGGPLNLLHALAILLVLSMGEDYSIFFVESAQRNEQSVATTLSLLFASLTTCVSFGGLAFSGVPALSAIGVTVAAGVFLSLLFTPVVWAVLPRSS